jgi:hypothetical protein
VKDEERQELLADLADKGHTTSVHEYADDVISIGVDLAKPGSDHSAPTVDLLSEAGATWLLDYAKDIGSSTFTDHGKLPFPMAIFACRREPDSAKLLERPACVLCPLDNDFFEGPGSKDRLAKWLRKLAQISEAFGYAFVTEAWTLPHTPGRLTPRGSWAKVADRGEVLQVVVEHVTWGAEIGGAAAVITRDGAGKPTLGPWLESRKSEGRFAGVLQTEEDRQAIRAMYQRVYTFKEAGWTKERMLESMGRQREKLQAGGEHEQDLADLMILLMQRVREDPNL